ncbi:alpha/beta hydrolase [Siminovitchia sediminis]|uniref:Alpha/beta hydrolase n=1 Tax=Siminovitchia sediminis TaxID=1274353 RepID=A0ABW4KIK0_9BACI
MIVVSPESFTYKSTNRAVLLLHGFTSNTNDVRMLGRHLQVNGYTCHAPLYQGHGAGVGELIKTSPQEWWKDAVTGYEYLISKGYEEIAVAGISMGGMFALHLAAAKKVKAVITMSAPVLDRKTDELFERVLEYAKRVKKLEGKNDEEFKKDFQELKQIAMPSLQDLRKCILQAGTKLTDITAPILVLQGCLDQPVYRESADLIFRYASSDNKQLKWYENSGHMITMGNERKQVNEDICQFLHSLEWESDVHDE